MDRDPALRVHEQLSRYVLPNGLTLLVRRDTTAPVVGLYTHVKAGYFDESDEQVGIAHVLEHMYFKGTPTRDVGVIARETKLAGGWLNAHTIYDHTAYVTALPSAALHTGLAIQFDAYANSLIDAGELERELEVIIQEARRKRDAPGAVTIESLFALLHDHHRIRRWRIGDPENLRTFTADMVRSFYRTWYVPSNTVLAVVGDVDPDEVHQSVLARYGTLPSGWISREEAPIEHALPGLRMRDITGDITQAHVAFGWRTPPQNHPDTPALELASLVLGSGRASRFYRAVRERQLASGVSAFHYTSGDVGVFVVHAEAPPERLADAALASWREVHAVRQFGIRPEELVRAQRVLEARWLRRMESMDGQAAYLASWEAEGGVDMGAEYYARLMQVTCEDVQQALARHLDPEQAGVLVHRPAHATALPTEISELRAWLGTVEDQDSAILPNGAPIRDANSAPRGSPVVAGSASGSQASPRAPEEIVHGVHTFRTRGDVPVLVHARPGTPMVHVGVFARGGAVSEADGVEGLTRLMVHSTLKGTRTRSGAQIALAAESLGGSIGVSAGLENVGWSMSVPVRHLDTALTLLADVVQSPAFPESGVETERRLALADVERLRDDMYRWPMRLALEAAYRGHPYSRSVLGHAHSLSAITSEHLVAHHARTVLQGECVVAVVGDVEPEGVAALVQERLGQLQWGPAASTPSATWTDSTRVAEDSREKQQTALAMLFHGPSRRDPDRFVGQVLSAICSGLGGRFFEELRDRRSLAYTVAAYPLERRMDGVFLAYIATTPEREIEARDGLLEQFAALRQDGVHADELERAKRYLIGAHAISQQSGGAVLGELVDAWMLGDGLSELSEYTSRIEAVTADQIHAFAQRYFDPLRRVEGVVRGQSRTDAQ